MTPYFTQEQSDAIWRTVFAAERDEVREALDRSLQRQLAGQPADPSNITGHTSSHPAPAPLGTAPQGAGR